MLKYQDLFIEEDLLIQALSGLLISKKELAG